MFKDTIHLWIISMIMRNNCLFAPGCICMTDVVCGLSYFIALLIMIVINSWAFNCWFRSVTGSFSPSSEIVNRRSSVVYFDCAIIWQFLNKQEVWSGLDSPVSLPPHLQPLPLSQQTAKTEVGYICSISTFFPKVISSSLCLYFLECSNFPI